MSPPRMGDRRMWRVGLVGDRLWGGVDGLWRGLTDCPVRSMGVVVRRVPVEQAPQVPVVEDEDSVERLPVERTDQPLADRVRSGRRRWRLDDLDSAGAVLAA
ncbi:MAG TPA: hypothetical protein VGS60_16655 [Actinomycetes bacterium]|nr:hypothetical protein [Actinomycetes bacterium]